MTNHPNRSQQQEAKHTAGPWYQTGETIREQASDAVICTISDGGHVTKRVISQATAEANARLIAAAPELLAALKTANTVIRNIAAPFGVKNGNEAIGEARLSEIRASLADTSAAIAKAEGR